MKATITYIGEAGTNVWGGVDLLPTVVFEKNKPVTIDTDTVPGNHKGFYEHLIKKARTNRFFEVADVKRASAKAEGVAASVEKKAAKVDDAKKSKKRRASESGA